MKNSPQNSNIIAENRSSILEKLNHYQWFLNTDTDIKNELLSLPEDHDGFLEDMIGRTDELDNMDILKLERLERGNHLITPVFIVRSHETNQVFTYEYVSWKSGANPGYKGILLIENENKITHFITKTIFKFSQNAQVYDSFGGFIEFKNKHLVNFPKVQEAEIKHQLGTDDLIIKEFIDLGFINPDIGMSNNRSSLFAAVIDGSQATRLMLDTPLKTKGISFKISIHPIDELPKLLLNINDSFFLSAIARLVAIGKLNLKLDK